MAPVIGSYLSPNFCFFSHWKAIPFQKKKLIYNFRAKGNKAQRGEWVLACYGEGTIPPLPLPSLASPGTHTCLPSPTLFLKPLKSPEVNSLGPSICLCLRPSWGQKRGKTRSKKWLETEWDSRVSNWTLAGMTAVDSSLGVSQWSSCGLRAGSGP